MNDIFAKLDALRSKSAVATGPVEYIIVGLGNPDKKYENTRHNIGFCAIDKLADKLSVKIDRSKYKALCTEATIGDKRVLLMKPMTYMNLSGQAVVEAMNFYKISIEKVIVIYDDVALDVGGLRIRGKGSHGGHNGIRNIIELTGKDTFPRIKVGVGEKPHKEYDLADWVLGKFTESDKKTIQPIFDEIKPLCQLMLEGDLEKVMAKYNK